MTEPERTKPIDGVSGTDDESVRPAPRRRARARQRPTVTATGRLGRPPSADSAETRARIIEVARQTFAEYGYDGATNKFIAAKAGITTAALYHYFESKLGLFVAVYEAAQVHVFSQFEAEVAAAGSFVGRIRAVMDAAHEMNRQDPSLARFLGSARVDIGRHDDLRIAVTGSARGGNRFVEGLVDRGISDGEIEPGHRARMIDTLRTMLVGLSDAVSDDLRGQRRAIDGLLDLLAARYPDPSDSAG